MHRAVALACVSAVAFGVTYADYAPLIPLIAADLGLDDVRSGLLSTGLFATGLCCGTATLAATSTAIGTAINKVMFLTSTAP